MLRPCHAAGSRMTYDRMTPESPISIYEYDDFRPYLGALKAVGYSGGISMECGWDDLRSEGPKAVEYLRAQMTDVGL